MSISGLINLILVLCLLGIVFWLLKLVIDRAPFGEPFKTVGSWILLVVAVLVCISVLFGAIPLPVLVRF